MPGFGRKQGARTGLTARSATCARKGRSGSGRRRRRPPCARVPLRPQRVHCSQGHRVSFESCRCCDGAATASECTKRTCTGRTIVSGRGGGCRRAEEVLPWCRKPSLFVSTGSGFKADLRRFLRQIPLRRWKSNVPSGRRARAAESAGSNGRETSQEWPPPCPLSIPPNDGTASFSFCR